MDRQASSHSGGPSKQKSADRLRRNGAANCPAVWFEDGTPLLDLLVTKIRYWPFGQAQDGFAFPATRLLRACKAAGMLAVLSALLCACVGEELRQDVSGIAVIRSWPLCEHERLGPVEGRDGHRGHLNGTVSGPRGLDATALIRLKLATRELGGDTVILIQRVVKERKQYRGSLNKFPPRLVILRGIAINGCQSSRPT